MSLTLRDGLGGERRFWIRMGGAYGFVEGQVGSQWLVRMFLPSGRSRSAPLKMHSTWVNDEEFKELPRIAKADVPERAYQAFLDRASWGS